MNLMKTKTTGVYFLFFLLLFFSFKVNAHAKPVTIVIDPGHGGTNLGGEYGGYREKDMTMIVANTIKSELEKYQDVTVYLTRTADVDMDLDARAAFAKSVNADFLYSIHFNKSPKGNLYGSEVWISAFGDNYAKGMMFGSIEIDKLKTFGLFNRGVKTKLGKTGVDYYGITRQCTALGIPSALIEHCHIDHPMDSFYFDHDAKLVTFGKADAESIAKYFHLKSSVLGVDYSNYKYTTVKTPSGVMAPDTTDPVLSQIALVSADKATGQIALNITGSDPESRIIYYDYSTDGGLTWSPLMPWTEGAKSMTITLTVPEGSTPDILCHVYNMYDKFKESNHLKVN